MTDYKETGHDLNEDDRDRALFDPVDRNFIIGRKEYEIPQNRYRRERVISDRLAGGLQDLRLFQRHAKPKLLEKLLPDETGAQRALRDDMVSAIALFYEIHETAGWDFEDTLRRSVDEAYTYGADRRDLQRKVVDEVRFHTETHTRTDSLEVRARVRRKLENGEKLTDHEIAEIVLGGNIDTIRWLQDYIKERRREESREEWWEEVKADITQFSEDTEEE